MRLVIILEAVADPLGECLGIYSGLGNLAPLDL
jgi:hypothetical protein